MAKWGTAVRVRNLRTKTLPNLGAYWRGTDQEFLEFLIQTIPQMPEQVRDAMYRFYVEGDTRRQSESGRPETADSRFYALLSEGKVALATMIRVANYEKRAIKSLERIYG